MWKKVRKGTKHVAFRRRGRQEAAMGATETAPATGAGAEASKLISGPLDRDPTVEVQEACAGRPVAGGLAHDDWGFKAEKKSAHDVAHMPWLPAVYSLPSRTPDRSGSAALRQVGSGAAVRRKSHGKPRARSKDWHRRRRRRRRWCSRLIQDTEPS